MIYLYIYLALFAGTLTYAVVASEDAHFYEHNGFSEEGLRRAYEEYKTGEVRHGGSTISQQTAKKCVLLTSQNVCT